MGTAPIFWKQNHNTVHIMRAKTWPPVTQQNRKTLCGHKATHMGLASITHTNHLLSYPQRLCADCLLSTEHLESFARTWEGEVCWLFHQLAPICESLFQSFNTGSVRLSCRTDGLLTPLEGGVLSAFFVENKLSGRNRRCLILKQSDIPAFQTTLERMYGELRDDGEPLREFLQKLSEWGAPETPAEIEADIEEGIAAGIEAEVEEAIAVAETEVEEVEETLMVRPISEALADLDDISGELVQQAKALADLDNELGTLRTRQNQLFAQRKGLVEDIQHLAGQLSS